MRLSVTRNGLSQTLLTVSFRGYTSTFDTWTSCASVKAQNGVTGCYTKYVALPCCTHGR